MIDFEWDEAKAKSNLQKYGVSFPEAQSIFYDEYALQFIDEEHSDLEERFIMLGMSNRLRVLVVIHCELFQGKTIRLISARKATMPEQKFYKGPLK